MKIPLWVVKVNQSLIDKTVSCQYAGVELAADKYHIRLGKIGGSVRKHRGQANGFHFITVSPGMRTEVA